MEAKQEEKTFQEKAKEIDVELSVKTAKMNLLLDLVGEINDLGVCVDCSNEYTYLETNQNLKTCQEILGVINKHIELLKV